MVEKQKRHLSLARSAQSDQHFHHGARIYWVWNPAARGPIKMPPLTLTRDGRLGAIFNGLINTQNEPIYYQPRFGRSS